MCTQNGEQLSYATLSRRQMCYTFGTFLASKCAAHLEPFSAYRILRNGHALYHAIDGSRKRLAVKPNVSPTSIQPHISHNHAPNALHIWSTKWFQMYRQNGTDPSKPRRRYWQHIDRPRKILGLAEVRNLGSPGTFPGGPVGATSCAGLL